MKNLLVLFLLLPFISFAQSNLPEGYKLLYQQDFEALAAEKDFTFAEANGWQFTEADGHGRVLELVRKNDYQPAVRSPHSIAMLKDLRFGDFVLEADYKQTGREYNHRDLCVFFGMVDKSHFYYTHIASIADPNAHNVFIVNDAPRKNFAEKTTKGVDWGSGWHKVRVERKIADGISQWADNLLAKKAQQLAAAKAADAKAALLERLGITADEAKLLLS